MHDEACTEMFAEKVCPSNMVNMAVGKDSGGNVGRVKTKELNIPNQPVKAHAQTAIYQNELAKV